MAVTINGDGPISSTLENLGNVSDTGPTAGDILVYDGSSWSHQAFSSVIQTTVSTSTITAGNTIVEWKDLPSGFVEIEFLGSTLKPSANAAYYIELSSDNGSTYATSGYNYYGVTATPGNVVYASGSDSRLSGTVVGALYFSGQFSRTSGVSVAFGHFNCRYTYSLGVAKSDFDLQSTTTAFNAIRIVANANASHTGVVRVIYHTA